MGTRNHVFSAVTKFIKAWFGVTGVSTDKIIYSGISLQNHLKSQWIPGGYGRKPRQQVWHYSIPDIQIHRSTEFDFLNSL
jgi:hypothetical protein